MQKIINNINNIIYDKKSGSVELIYKLIDSFLSNKNLKTAFTNNNKQISNLLIELKNKQNTFVNLTNFIDRILIILDLSDYQWFKTTLANEKKYYDNINNILFKNFLSRKINFNTCLLHSNSHTIKSLLFLFKENNINIKTIYQTTSVPGNEGLIQADFLKSLKYNVKIIDENNLNNYVNYIDVAFFGADIVCKDLCFVNKIKTKKIAETFKQSQKKAFVFADKNKIVNSDYKINFDKQLFEKIPIDIISEIIFP